VQITLVHGDDAGVHLDGHLQLALLVGDQLLVQRDEKTVSLLHPIGHSHYDMLRQKLNWG
jgi:NAD+ kinase